MFGKETRRKWRSSVVALEGGPAVLRRISKEKNKDMARLFSQHGPGWFSWSVSAAVPEGHPTALRRADAQRSNCGPCAVSSVAITYSVPYQQGRNKDTAWLFHHHGPGWATRRCFSHSLVTHQSSCRMSEYPGPDSVSSKYCHIWTKRTFEYRKLQKAVISTCSESRLISKHCRSTTTRRKEGGWDKHAFSDLQNVSAFIDYST